MAMKERPEVKVLADGGKTWEYTYKNFSLKAYVPATDIDGQTNNYTFRAPMLCIFEENKRTMDQAVAFAKESGFAEIASKVDSSVLFIYPTCEGGWKNATVDLYKELIAETRMTPDYHDGITEVNNFFTHTFDGYFIRGAIFRADIYSYGESADYVAKNLLKKIDGEYLWGPGEITAAMCSMERLSVKPVVERTDIGVLSVGNSDEINSCFKDCKNLLIKDKAEYKKDFYSFVRDFKMWCGIMEFEPDWEKLNMVEEPGSMIVKTGSDNRMIKDVPEHKVGWFAYYNKGLFDNGPVPLLVGCHGGGDSSMFLTFVSGWWEICHRYNFLYVSLDNHLNIPASEVIQIIEKLKTIYNIDEKRIYATGFSMGSGKTWDLYQEYPEVFAGLAPHSAMFPVKDNWWGKSISDGINETVSVPLFISGGEKSHLPELPFQAESCLDRLKYVAKTQKLKKNFDELKFSEKDKWDDPVFGITPDKIEKLKDETRGSVLTVRYYDSEDGVCRTACASIDNQIHECRHHTNEAAWKFISQFKRD